MAREIELDTEGKTRVEIHEGIVVRPGDALVVSMNRQATRREVDELAEMLRVMMPFGATVTVLANGVHASVMRAADDPPPLPSDT